MIFEDEHLLVVNKPAGWNTHAPHPYAGEGIYDWLKQREARWASLAIIHRLDKETSGLLVFSKTPVANRSLTRQFTERTVRKKYWLLTDRPLHEPVIVVKSVLVRSGEKYLSRPPHPGGNLAETHFRAVSERETDSRHDFSGCSLLEAEPRTGRTHQIRVHAADRGFPVLGDTLYGGTPARRLYLHAMELGLTHPANGTRLSFHSPLNPSAAAQPAAVSGSKAAFPFTGSSWVGLTLREALIEPDLTNVFRLLHGASDGWPDWYVDRLGDYLLSQSASPLSLTQREVMAALMAQLGTRSMYHKTLRRQKSGGTFRDSSPQLVIGDSAPDRFQVRENGLLFELSFQEGYSIGLFLDQRDNRRRLLSGHIGAGFDLKDAARDLSKGASVLNAFAYTCAFSVCAAKAGARTLSLDLSQKYLEWGRSNFKLNELDPTAHEFLYGDVFDWFRRLARKQREFALIVLDPPTFSQSKASGVFQAEKDYGRLLKAVLPLLEPGGVLFASSNAATWSAPDFLETVRHSIKSAGRTIAQSRYFPQPPDFPISRAESGFLKSTWLRVE